MKYAVIGADEFIGSRVVEAMHLGEGASIVAISATAADHALAARFSVDLRTADLRSMDATTKALERCSTVIFTAEADAANLKKRAVTVARAAAAAGARRVIYVSTMTPRETNASPNSDDVGEPQRAGSQPFEEHQFAAERQFHTECRRAGISGFVLRAPFVYGPRSRIVADIVTELQENRAWLLDGGKTAFDGIYIDNLITAIRLCLKAKVPIAETLYVADAEKISWRDFYEGIARELDLSASRIRNLGSPDELRQDRTLRTSAASVSANVRIALQRSTLTDGTEKAAKQLGYAPTITLAEGLHRTCAWWRYAHGELAAVA